MTKVKPTFSRPVMSIEDTADAIRGARGRTAYALKVLVDLYSKGEITYSDLAELSRRALDVHDTFEISNIVAYAGVGGDSENKGSELFKLLDRKP